MSIRREEELAELDEKIVLAELLQLQKFFLQRYDNPLNAGGRSFTELQNLPRNILKDATKHDALVAAHSRKVIESLRKRPEIRQRISFITRDEETVIRVTLSLESAFFILGNHYDHYYHMEVQHESNLGQPRQRGYTLVLMKRQMEFIMGELEKIINAIRQLILIEENLKTQLR